MPILSQQAWHGLNHLRLIVDLQVPLADAHGDLVPDQLVGTE